MLSSVSVAISEPGLFGTVVSFDVCILLSLSEHASFHCAA